MRWREPLSFPVASEPSGGSRVRTPSCVGSAHPALEQRGSQVEYGEAAEVPVPGDAMTKTSEQALEDENVIDAPGTLIRLVEKRL